MNSLQLHKIKLGLEAMESFLEKVGKPQKKLRFVHVAGTNGKGSVCSALVSVYRQAGYKIGLYTSPHLHDIRERFKINDRYISKNKFAAIVSIIKNTLGEEKITYFECTTAIALLWFTEEKPDLVVLETGLGGRLDATNVVTPLVSVITNVSLDHEVYLGNTVEQVAGEKAGIVKPGVPVVSGCEGIAASVVEVACQKMGSDYYQLDQHFMAEIGEKDVWSYQPQIARLKPSVKKMTCSLKGRHQVKNMSLVVVVSRLLQDDGFTLGEEELRKGIETVSWPGRQESFMVKKDGRQFFYLLDGGHNPAGIASLVDTLKEEYGENKIYLIWAAMADKDSEKTLPELAGLCEEIYITRPESERSALPENIYGGLRAEVQRKCALIPVVQEALLKAEQNSDKDSMIVVAGSLFLVGLVRFILLGNLVEA